MRHLMSPLDLSKEELEDLLTLASDIEKNPKKSCNSTKRKIKIVHIHHNEAKIRQNSSKTLKTHQI